MARPIHYCRAFLSLLIPLGSMIWVLSIPQRLGFLVFSEQILALLLGAAISIIYLTATERANSDLTRYTGPLCASLAIAIGIYLAVRIPTLAEEAFFRPVESLLVAIIVIPLLVDAMRRSVGWSLVVVFTLFVLYALFCDLIPGQLQGRASEPTELLSFLATDTTAMLGLPLSVTCFVVVMFVLFGRVLQTTGGTEFFTGLSQALAGRGPGSPAKVSIIASSLFGSISGSAVSNVMSTGVVTIPMMKKSGLPPHRAGAIESVASTGGQLMPPIMGAAAFLMAEFLQMPYKDIIVAALIPAILYYLAVFLQVDFLARKSTQVINTEDETQSLSVGAVLRSGWLLPIPFAVLIIALFQFNLSPEYSVLIALLSLVSLSWLRRAPNQRMTPARILQDMMTTGQTVAELILVTAVAGMIIGILNNTGLAFGLGFVLLGFGEGSLFTLLLITAAVCIVLGMGLPTTGVYLLLATLAAPPLVDLGLEPIQAHMFVLYFGMLSMITPPVALAAFAAASLAGAKQMRTGFEAMRFGWCAYLVPFLFIYNPALLMQGSVAEILLVTMRILLVLLLISAVLAGHALTSLTPLKRVLIAILAIALLLSTKIANLWVNSLLMLTAIAVIAIHVYVFMAKRYHVAP